MPVRQKRKEQALMVELQNYAQQGISIWLGDDDGYSGRDTAAPYVREEISYRTHRNSGFDLEKENAHKILG